MKATKNTSKSGKNGAKASKAGKNGSKAAKGTVIYGKGDNRKVRTVLHSIPRAKNPKIAKRLNASFHLTANKTAVRGTIMGESMGRVIRHCAATGWGVAEVVALLEAVGGPVSMNTIYSQHNSGVLSTDKKTLGSAHHGAAPGYGDEPKIDPKAAKEIKAVHALVS
jgi:hypothetical protein